VLWIWYPARKSQANILRIETCSCSIGVLMSFSPDCCTLAQGGEHFEQEVKVLRSGPKARRIPKGGSSTFRPPDISSQFQFSSKIITNTLRMLDHLMELMVRAFKSLLREIVKMILRKCIDTALTRLWDKTRRWWLGRGMWFRLLYSSIANIDML
jgi:hypothetical protein